MKHAIEDRLWKTFLYNFEKEIVSMGEPRSTYLNNWLKLFLQKDKFKNEMNFLCITINYQNSSGVKFIFWKNGGWRDTYFARSNITKIQVTIPGQVL